MMTEDNDPNPQDDCGLGVDAGGSAYSWINGGPNPAYGNTWMNASTQVDANGDADDVGGTCRGWISNFSIGEKAISLGDLVTTVFDEGLEHHFGLVQDEYTDAIHEWSYWVGSRCIEPIAYSNGRGSIRSQNSS